LLLCLRAVTINPALITSDNPEHEGCIITLPLLDPSQNHIRLGTGLQIKEHKKSARPTICVKFCTLGPEIC
jgi:hypothetical protein